MSLYTRSQNPGVTWDMHTDHKLTCTATDTYYQMTNSGTAAIMSLKKDGDLQFVFAPTMHLEMEDDGTPSNRSNMVANAVNEIGLFLPVYMGTRAYWHAFQIGTRKNAPEKFRSHPALTAEDLAGSNFATAEEAAINRDDDLIAYAVPLGIALPFMTSGIPTSDIKATSNEARDFATGLGPTVQRWLSAMVEIHRNRRCLQTVYKTLQRTDRLQTVLPGHGTDFLFDSQRLGHTEIHLLKDKDLIPEGWKKLKDIFDPVTPMEDPNQSRNASQSPSLLGGSNVTIKTHTAEDEAKKASKERNDIQRDLFLICNTEGNAISFEQSGRSFLAAVSTPEYLPIYKEATRYGDSGARTQMVEGLIETHFEKASKSTPFEPASTLRTDTGLFTFSHQACIQWDKSNYCSTPLASLGEEKVGFSVLALLHQKEVGDKHKAIQNAKFTKDLENELDVIDADKTKPKAHIPMLGGFYCNSKDARGLLANVVWFFKGIVKSAKAETESQSIIITLHAQLHHKLIDTKVQSWDKKFEKEHPHFPFYLLYVCDQILIRFAKFANSPSNVLACEKKAFEDLDLTYPQAAIDLVGQALRKIDECVGMEKAFPKDLVPAFTPNSANPAKIQESAMIKRIMEAAKTNSGDTAGRGGNNTQASGNVASNKRQKKNEKEGDKEAEKSSDDNNARKVDLKKKGSVMTRVRGSTISNEELLGTKTYTKKPCPDFHVIGRECSHPNGECPNGEHKALVKMVEEDRKTFLDQQLQTKKTYLNRGLKKNPGFMTWMEVNTQYKELFKPEEGASS